MNERIEELALQAEIDANKLIDNNGIDPRQYPRYFAEKFAELIVKECTNMLPEDTIRNEDGLHMFYVIREHFGVSTIGR